MKKKLINIGDKAKTLTQQLENPDKQITTTSSSTISLNSSTIPSNRISKSIKELVSTLFKPNVLIKDDDSLVTRLLQWQNREKLSRKLTTSAIAYELYHVHTYLDLCNELEQFIIDVKKIPSDRKKKIRGKMLKIIYENWDISVAHERKLYRAAKRIGDLLKFTTFEILSQAGLQVSDLYESSSYYNLFYKALTNSDCDEVKSKCKYN